MEIRGIGRRPDEHAPISAELDLLRDSRPPEARAAEAVAVEGGASVATSPTRVGVVVIHGIGDQKPGQTLLLWAQSLGRIVQRWAATSPGVVAGNDPVATADIDFSGSDRTWVALEVPADATHEPQTWLLTEAWWAARVSAPSLGQMFGWLFPREIWRLWSGILKGIGSAGTEGRWLFKIVDSVFLPVFLVPGTVLMFILYVLLRLVRVIPIPALRENALFASIDVFLVSWFGDLRTLLVDRTQAANIRTRAADAITACIKAGCDTVVVIGHSGGTIVGYTTLVDPAYKDTWWSTSKPSRPGEPVGPRRELVSRFITLGQALGMGWRFGHATDGPSPDRVPDHLYAGDKLVRTPAEAGREALQWYDFWATHDPAPAGGFNASPSVIKPESVHGHSTQVHNRMSLLEDHGAYWDNDEEFLLPVARLLDTALSGADPSTSRFFIDANTEERSVRRRKRVEILQAAWVGVMAAGALAVPMVLVHPFTSASGSSLLSAANGAWDWLAGVTSGLLKGWLGLVGVAPLSPSLDPLAAGVLGVAIMVGAFYGVGWIASGIWDAWDLRERQIALSPAPAWRSAWWLAVPLALCGLGALALLGFAGSGDWVLVAPTVVLIALAEAIRVVTPKGSVSRPAVTESEPSV